MTDTEQLNRELDELETAAKSYDAQHEFIEGFAWPEGTQIAVNFTCDFDAMLFRRYLEETPMQLAQGEFGGRVGIWRLIELFSGNDVTATIFTPSMARYRGSSSGTEPNTVTRLRRSSPGPKTKPKLAPVQEIACSSNTRNCWSSSSRW